MQLKNARTADELSEAMLDVDLDDWDRAFATNVRGPYLVTAAFLPLLARASESAGRDKASVVNISSARFAAQRRRLNDADLRSNAVDTARPLLLQHQPSSNGSHQSSCAQWR